MSDKTLHVGVVGAGYIANIHSAALRTVAGTFPEIPLHVSLSAVADADPARASALAGAWGWARSTDDWKTITRADDVDIVDICVPNVLHAAVALDALNHGKHVICEKPLADDIASARAMAAAAESTDLFAQVCLYYRLWPAIAWARTLIDEGAIGALRYFRGWMLQDYAASAGHDLGWRGQRGEAGAGALGDLGTHIFDLARYLCGEITAVCAVTPALVDRGAAGIDDAVSALVAFESGLRGVIEASWAMRGHKCDFGFDLIGSDGAIRFSWERLNEIEVLTGDADDPTNGFRRVLIGAAQPDAGRFVAVPGQGLGYRDAFTIGLGHFLGAMATGARTVAPSFRDGLHAAELVDAAARSSTGACWVSLGNTAAKQP